MQIKTKLTLTYFLVTAGLLLLVLVLIYVSFKDQMEKQFYLSLRTNALMTFSMLEKVIMVLTMSAFTKLMRNHCSI